MQFIRYSAKQPFQSLGATAQSYVTGNVMGVPTKFAGVVCDPGGVAVLNSLYLIDQSATDLAIDLYFFNQLPTTQGADAAAFALSAAEGLFLIGTVHIASTNYTASSHVGIASINNLWMTISGQQQVPATNAPSTNGGRDIWVVAVARGSITTGSANQIWLGLGIQQF